MQQEDEVNRFLEDDEKAKVLLLHHDLLSVLNIKKSLKYSVGKKSLNFSFMSLC